MPSLGRLAHRPGLLGAALFLATMGLAGALAWQAARAAASHRAAAEAALSHHASIAAWRFAQAGRGWIGYGMGEAGSALLRETSQRTALPGPDVLLRVLAEKECDCMSAGFGRTFFRVTNDSAPSISMIGEPLSERAKDSLLAIVVAAAADTLRRGGSRQWLILPPGAPRLNRATDVVLFWKVGDRTRGLLATYGMIVEPEQIARPLRGALDDMQLFPPSLVSPAASASLVHIDVAGPNTQPVFATGPDTRTFAGTDTLGAQFGDLTVTAAIDPAAAQLLIVGGLPASRVPTIIVLFALALAMGGGALVLLRREHRLAQLREDFVSGVSHELRTPLTQIRMLSELLQTDGFHTDAERTRATNVIHREALRLSNLVDNILDFARRRRAVASGPPARIGLADVLEELRESFAPLLDEQRDRLELIITDDVEIPADRDAVNRVLRNLVENAIKYGPGGQTIRVTLSRAAETGNARVTVDDEGRGIPADDRARIWQPYYRLDRDRNAPAGGSGLGLSVVADLMRELGGTASVSDAPGRGARFTVEFPGAMAREVQPA